MSTIDGAAEAPAPLDIALAVVAETHNHRTAATADFSRPIAFKARIGWRKLLVASSLLALLAVAIWLIPDIPVQLQSAVSIVLILAVLSMWLQQCCRKHPPEATNSQSTVPRSHDSLDREERGVVSTSSPKSAGSQPTEEEDEKTMHQSDGSVLECCICLQAFDTDAAKEAGPCGKVHALTCFTNPLSSLWMDTHRARVSFLVRQSMACGV